MLYTKDFSMRHYVGFSQIRSHIDTRDLHDIYMYLCHQPLGFSSVHIRQITCAYAVLQPLLIKHSITEHASKVRVIYNDIFVFPILGTVAFSLSLPMPGIA